MKHHRNALGSEQFLSLCNSLGSCWTLLTKRGLEEDQESRGASPRNPALEPGSKWTPWCAGPLFAMVLHLSSYSWATFPPPTSASQKGQSCLENSRNTGCPEEGNQYGGNYSAASPTAGRLNDRVHSTLTFLGRLSHKPCLIIERSACWETQSRDPKGASWRE